jgi:hypothetical protein
MGALRFCCKETVFRTYRDLLGKSSISEPIWLTHTRVPFAGQLESLKTGQCCAAGEARANFVMGSAGSQSQLHQANSTNAVTLNTRLHERRFRTLAIEFEWNWRRPDMISNAVSVRGLRFLVLDFRWRLELIAHTMNRTNQALLTACIDLATNLGNMDAHRIR